jgi:hypothetical protein
MGFEYKIIVQLTKDQIQDISFLLEKNEYFEKKYYFGENEFWDFRHSANQGKLPNLSIILEQDGIYICQNSASYLWTNLDELKNYIETKIIEYKILDYSD